MKKITFLLTLVLVTGAFTGCRFLTGADDNVSDTATQTVGADAFDAFTGEGLNEAEKLVIGYQPNEELVILEETQHFVENIFAEDDIEIEWVEFSYGAPLVEALAAGSIDVGTSVGDTPFTNALSNAAHIEGIYVYPIDPNAYTIVVSEESNQKIFALEDLSGKRIAYLAGSAGEDFIVKELASVDLTPDDVEFVNISSTEDQFAALLTGDVDAVVSIQPQSSNFIYENGGVLLDYGESEKNSLNLGVANTDYAMANPEIVAKFVAAKIQADEYVDAHREEYKAAYSERTEYPVEVLTNIDRLVFRTEFIDSDYEDLESTMQFMLRTGALDEEVDFTGTLTNKYLDEAKRLLGIE